MISEVEHFFFFTRVFAIQVSSFVVLFFCVQIFCSFFYLAVQLSFFLLVALYVSWTQALSWFLSFYRLSFSFSQLCLLVIRGGFCKFNVVHCVLSLTEHLNSDQPHLSTQQSLLWPWYWTELLKSFLVLLFSCKDIMLIELMLVCGVRLESRFIISYMDIQLTKSYLFIYQNYLLKALSFPHSSVVPLCHKACVY